MYGDGLCVIPDVEVSLGIKAPHTIKAGCEGDIKTIFTPQNCYGIGVFSVYAQLGKYSFHIKIQQLIL
jgi:hypothetical protein